MLPDDWLAFCITRKLKFCNQNLRLNLMLGETLSFVWENKMRYWERFTMYANVFVVVKKILAMSCRKELITIQHACDIRPALNF